MKVRALDTQHDWTFGHGKDNYLSGSMAIAQHVKTRLLSFKNDWFLNMDHGLPWFDHFDKPAQQSNVEQMVKKYILDTDGVIQLTSFSIDFDVSTRKLQINASYIDQFGQQQHVNNT